MRIFTQNCVTFTLDYIVMQIRNVNGLLQQIINVLENETKLKKKGILFFSLLWLVFCLAYLLFIHLCSVTKILNAHVFLWVALKNVVKRRFLEER